jgi:ribosomal protein S18 acetylase RimI-like enzyme
MELHHGEMQRSVAPRRNRSGFLNSTRLRLKLLKSLGFFGNDRSESVYERVTSPRDLESAYRLVHDIYVDTGYIDPHPNGLRLRHFECSPDTATFVARAPSRAIARAPSRAMVGVLTVIMDSPDFGLPSDSIYQKEIDQIRREGGVLCEFSNQVVLPPYRRRGPRAELMRCALAYAFSQGATDIVCAVTPSVAPFYESMAFQQVGEVRSYSKNIDDPVVLIRESQIQTRGQTSHLLEDEVYGALVRYMYSDNP